MEQWNSKTTLVSNDFPFIYGYVNWGHISHDRYQIIDRNLKELLHNCLKLIINTQYTTHILLQFPHIRRCFTRTALIVQLNKLKKYQFVERNVDIGTKIPNNCTPGRAYGM